MNRRPNGTLLIIVAVVMSTAAAAGGRSAGDASGYEEERVVGYDVKHQYEGRVFHIRMDRDPGRRGTGRCGGGRIINLHTGVVGARRIARVPDLLTLCD